MHDPLLNQSVMRACDLHVIKLTDDLHNYHKSDGVLG